MEEGETQCTFAPGEEEDCCMTCEVCTAGDLVPQVPPSCEPLASGD